MKKIKVLLPFLILAVFSSCVSVRVASDYDKKTDFKEYKTYAFYKTGIDKAQISDLNSNLSGLNGVYGGMLNAMAPFRPQQ